MLLTKVRKASSLITNPRLLLGRVNYLFILSHMRSRSTLLAHLLGSNRAIHGYRELQRSYTGSISLLKMRVELFNEFRFRSTVNTYLLDKLLHGKMKISVNVLESFSPKIIYLVREPRSTIKSIVAMGRQLDDLKLTSVNYASDYYCTRLRELQDFSRQADCDCFFIESDELISSPENRLAYLTQWLNLAEPLQQTYRKFNHTGEPIHGDPSAHIVTGKIRMTPENPDIEFQADKLREAEQLYQEVCTAFRIDCNTGSAIPGA